MLPSAGKVVSNAEISSLSKEFAHQERTRGKVCLPKPSFVSTWHGHISSKSVGELQHAAPIVRVLSL
eukprot:scaffold7_cov414-Pavlova_lutheri.AAC.4